MKATIIDVAKESGVSVATVSRVKRRGSRWRIPSKNWSMCRICRHVS